MKNRKGLKMKTRLYSAMFILLGLLASTANAEYYGVQDAWDNPENNMLADSKKPGYAQLTWAPGAILPVKLRNGMITIINMPNGEQIADAYVGSPEYFEITTQGTNRNTLMVMPAKDNQGADTNLIIMGKSGNKYVLYLRSEPSNTNVITHSMVDILIDGNASVSSLASTATASGAGGLNSIFGGKKTSTGLDDEDYGWIKSIKVDPTEFRFDLDIFVPNPDDYVIAPERVWRDKIFTYIDFGDKVIAMTQRPVVSILIEGGESPVGFRTDGPNGRLLVVESVGDLVLRSGQRIVCIKKREKPFLISDPASVYALASANVEQSASLNNIYSQPASMYNQPMGQTYGAPQTTMMVNPGTMQTSALGTAMATAPMSSTRSTRGSYLPGRDIPIISSNQTGVAVELGSDTSVKSLNDYWTKLLATFNSTDGAQGILAPYSDRVFFAVDEQGVGELGSASTTGRLYRLRVGPIGSIDEAQKLCDQLTKFQGTSCHVVRIQ